MPGSQQSQRSRSDANVDAALWLKFSLHHARSADRKPLVELAVEGKRTAAISVCDITRPAPSSVTLPPLLERLHRAGISVDGVTIMIATGLHRNASQDEIEIILGPEIAAKYRVVSHDARDFAGASRPRLNQAGNAGVHRRAIYGRGPAHHAWIY